MRKNMHLFDLYWEDILVAKVMPLLTIQECLVFRTVSVSCMQIVDMYFTKLKSLRLMNKGFSPHTILIFSKCCRRLTSLNLSRCYDLSDSLVAPLLLRNPNLVSLNLSQCKSLTARALQPAILYCKQLRTLKLAHCAWVTTGAMEALALHQSKLEDVDLSYCPYFSESCVLIFIKKFRHLRMLNLEGDKQLTDKTIFALSQYSKSLKVLNLSGCVEVSNQGIRSLAQYSPALQGILVRGCVRVTESSLIYLRKRGIHLDRKPEEPNPLPIHLQARQLWYELPHEVRMATDRHAFNLKVRVILFEKMLESYMQ